jgi:release factor glutamine methyltransferase
VSDGGTSTLADSVRALRRRFEQAGLGEAALDARLLVAEASGLEPGAVILYGDRRIDAGMARRIEQLAKRRLAGEPVGRILGRRDFWGMTFRLSPETLEPRPDTETLVEAVLSHVDREGLREAPLVLADLGTGTGAIAIALLSELPRTHAVASDVADGALRMARENAARLGVGDRFHAVGTDFGAALTGGFDLIVSNPPYIALGERPDLSREVRDHDPELALFAGTDGLDAYRAITADLPRVLRPGGRAFLEIGWRQGGEVSGLLREAGLEEIQVLQDLGGRDRVVAAQCVAK